MKTNSAIPLPVLFDREKLREDLQKIATDEWISHYRGDHYEGGWAVTPLRSVGGHSAVIYSSPAGTNPNFYKDTPILERCPYFQTAIKWFQCQVNGARLMRLDPGARILEHTDDMDDGNTLELRIHIPVETNPRVEFWVDGKLVPMQEGEVWYADFNLPHSVNNNGSAPRTHLVLDCSVNPWLETQLERGQQIAQISAFLNGIGIATRPATLEAETFLPGVKIEAGCILYDFEKLQHPGDLLHEAGHIAVVPAEERKHMTGNVGMDDKNAMGDEIAAILWSYAALKAIGLPPEAVFHQDGYKGQSEWHIENFTGGNYIGLPLLEWFGMAAGGQKAIEKGVKPFPAMIRWLR
ncbi:MAG: aspartyl/asparaginyl beta-hydroxylase domain-containing protein [Saprospiraceae bacterium]|nr:aspartyl/asparaginyl beta-hydroxylase domain-containing protein [Saprospiraceae bacterium]